MRPGLLLLVSILASAQPRDPTYEPLSKAYALLQTKQYEEAIEFFRKAIDGAPGRADIRKDLAYTYLKVGETEAARDQFAAAMRLDPADHHVTLEYAYLCHETKMQAEARRAFDSIRKSGDPSSRATAEQAFQNIDQPLAAGIDRWKKALALAPESFTAHYELAGLAEQRNELELAVKHYRRAWELLPGRKQTLLDLGRVWKALGRVEDTNAALMSAAWGGEPRAREAARELLPERYPYVVEFRRALELDPNNIELRRELAFLLLAMERQPDAEREFRLILERAPGDLLSCAQLGFLYRMRDEKARAKPLLDVVLRGSEVSLANRVRAALGMPLLDSVGQPWSDDAKVMAERSLKAGYLNDALQYLHSAHSDDPNDGWVTLKLGWTYNILHLDNLAIQWFRLARNSQDPSISAEASKAYHNLRPAFARLRTTAWLYPFFSTRWHDTFSYAQIKTDLKLGKRPVRPYVSVRWLGDTRKLTTRGVLPEYLSENSVVLAAGVATNYWRGLMAWGEAGSAISYVKRGRVERFTPDFRGGLSFAKGFGHLIGAETPGWFFEINLDTVFVSRFENDLLFYAQTRLGLTPPRLTPLGSFQTQFFWNNNFVRDAKSLDWANYAETGPGMRFRWPWMPRSLLFSVNALRGAYSVPQYYRSSHFVDLRAGFWYAVTR